MATTNKPSLFTKDFSQDESEIQFSENIALRLESFAKGMDLLIENLSENDWKKETFFSTKPKNIKEVAASLFRKYCNKLQGCPLKKKETCFYEFISEYVNLLKKHTTLTDPLAALNKAERYSVLFSTQNSIKISSNVPIDLPLNNCQSIIQDEQSVVDPKQHASYAHIVEENDENNAPFWFKSLAPFEKNIIKKNWSKNDEGPSLYPTKIPSSLRSIPGLANLFRHTLQTDGKERIRYFRHATQVVIDLLKNKDPAAKKEIFRLTCENVASQIRLSIKQHSENNPNHNELVILTQSLVSPGFIADLKSQFISDASDNDTQIYEIKEKVVALFQHALAHPNEVIRSEDQPLVSLFFAESNKISEITYHDFLNQLGTFSTDITKSNSSTLDNLKITLLSTNHPINNLRRFGVYAKQTERNELNITKLLQCAGNFLASQWPCPNSREELSNIFDLRDRTHTLLALLKKGEDQATIAKTIRLIQGSIKNHHQLREPLDQNKFDDNTLRLLDALQAYLSIPPGQGVGEEDQRHRQLMMSALEVIIVYHLKGESWVACKSGKDRTGGLSATIDAMLIFYEQHGHFPCFNDPKAKRENFLNILRDLIQSGHQQKIAASNAPGAAGLINQSSFLPDDLFLDKKKEQQGTKLARLNKPKHAKIQNIDFSQDLEKYIYQTLLEEELTDLQEYVTKNPQKEQVLIDWRRSLKNYFINGKSINDLLKEQKNPGDENKQEGINFQTIEELSDFIDKNLLYNIEDQELRKQYLEFVLSSFHQTGFPHIFNLSRRKAAQKCSVDFSQPKENLVNFTALENGIRIEENNYYNEIVKFNEKTDNPKITADENNYLASAFSSIDVTIKKNQSDNQNHSIPQEEMTPDQKTTFNHCVNFAYFNIEDTRLEPIFYPQLTYQLIINFFIKILQQISNLITLKKDEVILSAETTLLIPTINLNPSTSVEHLAPASSDPITMDSGNSVSKAIDNYLTPPVEKSPTTRRPVPIIAGTVTNCASSFKSVPQCLSNHPSSTPAVTMRVH